MNVGIDMAEIERFETARVSGAFAAAELEYIDACPNRAETMAGLFCAKEAYCKAAGTGITLRQLPNIEIAHDDAGRPFYKNAPNAALSISHTKTTAVAVCILTDK